MKDPFTYEDVRNAREMFVRYDGYDDACIRAALLAGTERLRAQGTWNEAIEAAAKWHETIAEDYDADARAYKADDIDSRPSERAAALHRKYAKSIRAIKRKETP